MGTFEGHKRKGVGRTRRFSRRAIKGVRLLPSLLSNLLAGNPEPLGLWNLLSMSWAAQGVHVVTQLEIPKLLQSGAKTVTELAKATGTVEARLSQVMRALAGFGLFTRTKQGEYALTPMSESLVADSPLKLYVKVWGEQLFAAGGKMLDMVRSGKVAFEVAHEIPCYQYYKQNPEAGNLFVSFMNSVTDDQSLTFVQSFDFRPYRHVIDVGGGRASLLTTLLQLYPTIRGTILDQPHMADAITERIHLSNVSGRCQFVGGNFLESVPAGGDLYLIKSVLHDWDDRSAVTILRNIVAQMRSGCKLIVIEGLMDDRDGAERFLKMRDLEQMVWCGGKVRTRLEFEELLDQAGLFIEEIRQTGIGDGTLIVARKKQQVPTGSSNRSAPFDR